VVFGSVSASAGVLCLTCLATYILVLAFAGVAWRGLPGPVLPQSGEWRRTLPWPVGFALVGFVAVSIPGWATPKPSYSPAPMPEASSVGEGSLEAYLRSLSPRDQRFIAEALAEYRRQTPLPVKAPARFREGPVDAPVKIVEWTDPLCPHCRMLVKAMGEMKKHVPEGMMSIEARHFPLDGGCNPNISPDRTDGGLRCLAAKATICLEGAPDFWEMREKLFDAQTVLTLNNVLDIAGSGKSVNRAQLEACVNSPDTARKLQEDIAYVAQYRPDGTPFVVVNGREAVPGVPFLYALVLAGGDVNHPAFRMLPPVDISAASSP
jgi:serine/threonine-protein kinase